MAEKTISHLIEVTKQENAESRGVTQEVASEVGALAKMFGKYFQELKNNAGDRQEEKQEEKAPAAGGLPDLSTLMSDTKGMGIFGIIAGITAAIAGLAVGIVEGFASAAKLILSPFTKIMVKMVRSITKFMLAPFRLFVNKFFPDIGKKLQNQFNRIRKVFTNGIARIAKRIKQLKDWAKGIGGRLAAVATNIRQAFVNGFQSINAGIRGIAGKFRKLTFIENASKMIGKFFRPFTAWFDDIAKLGKVVGGQGKKSAGIISKIGGFFKSFKGIFSGFFTIFRTLGRVIFFPITIIMTMVDAFNGFKEGFASGGLIGGVIGAISGVLKGLIGMPLDLIKNVVSWIASKLGFENFSEILDSFSFSDMIGGLFNSITDNLLGFMDGIKDDFANMSFAGAIAELGKKLFNVVTSIMKFPLAVAVGGAAAIGALMPGGKSPMEAFGDAFSAVMNFGKFDTNTSEKIAAREEGRADLKASKAKESEIKPNAPQSSDRINEGTKEVKASEAASGGGNLAVQHINAPTTSHINQSSAVYGDASPATDPLDRVSSF
tara:strand:- start:46 stop:1686 length:1641 start_codon:yes stop_codon:yes gene_type:complete